MFDIQRQLCSRALIVQKYSLLALRIKAQIRTRTRLEPLSFSPTYLRSKK